METAYGLQIPQSLDEACQRERTALVVYDMKLGTIDRVSPTGARADIRHLPGRARSRDRDDRGLSETFVSDDVRFVFEFPVRSAKRALAPPSISGNVAARFAGTDHGSTCRRHREPDPAAGVTGCAPRTYASASCQSRGERVARSSMSSYEEKEVLNDPRQRHLRGRAVLPNGLIPYVLASLALWLLLLIVFPAWVSGGLVIALLVACMVSAIVPLLPKVGAARPGVRIVGFGRGSQGL